MFHNSGAEHELYLGMNNVLFVKRKAILHWSWELGHIKLRLRRVY